MPIRFANESKSRVSRLSDDKDYENWISKLEKLYPYLFVFSILLFLSIPLFVFLKQIPNFIVVPLAMLDLLFFFMAVSFRKAVKEFKNLKKDSTRFT